MRTFVYIVAMTIAIVAQAQYDVPQPDKNIWPESPRARALREIDMPTAALLTGACQFSVPLYTIQVEGISIPLSLEYRSNGVRIDDDPQPIGYGWVMTPVLRATRRILGRPDGKYPFAGNMDPNIFESQYDKGFSAVNMTYATGSIPDSLNYIDTEHDIFTVHLLEKTLTLIFDNGTFRGVGCDEYRIQTDNSISFIKVTDPQGVIYNFNIVGECINEPINQTEWLLSSLILPSGRAIQFNWRNSNHSARGQSSFGPVTMRCGWDAPQFSEVSDPRNGSYTNPYTYINTKDIASIIFPGGAVLFDYTGSGLSFCLNSIRVSNGSEQVFSATLLHEQGPELLTGVSFGAEGVYRFMYNAGCFNVTSRDWWGFYNGKSNDALSSPAVTLKQCNGYTYRDEELDGADFSVDTVAMRAYMLEQAIFPTGGIVQWQYEVHKFAPQGSPGTWVSDHLDDITLSYGGGLRVKSITMRESYAAPARTKQYIYGDNGNGNARVVALPLLHTFISDTRLYQYRVASSSGVGNHYDNDRFVVVNSNSDYLTGQIGCVPLWYSTVTEIDAEGKNVYHFANLVDTNQVIREWGRAYPQQINTAFSNGPQLTSTERYKYQNGTYALAEQTTNNYEIIRSSQYSYPNVSVIRDIIQLDYGAYIPDWDKDVLTTMVSLPTWQFLPQYGITDQSYGTIGLYSYQWLMAHGYTINPQSERLVSSTTTIYTPTGNYVRTQSNSYIPGTGLIMRSILSDGFSEITTDYTYTDTFSNSVTSSMYSRNVVGVVTGIKQTIGNEWIAYNSEMVNCGNAVYRPKRLWQSSSSGVTWSDAIYTYNSFGNLLTKTDNAGICESWTWDNNGLYPLTHNIGGELTSTATWKPLVGVLSTTDPAGLASTYTYDSNGRLSSTSVGGRLLQEYNYCISPTQGNMTTTKSFYSASDFTTVVEQFDGLGRPTASTVNMPSSPVATLIEYDIMGRPKHNWRPTPVSSTTPTGADIKTSAIGFYADSKPYVLTEYDPTTRDICSRYLPGEQWHNADHHNTRTIRVNTVADRCLHYRATSDSVIAIGYYSPSELIVEEITNEEGIVNAKFTDLRGNVVMTNNAGTSTAYVYDGKGLLRYIIPGTFNSRARTDRQMQDYAYWYDYDERGRCILRRIPTRAVAEYLYDPAGRIAAEHSPSQSDPDTWLLYGYDNLGRQVVTIEMSLGRFDAADFASEVRTAVLDAPMPDEWNRGGYSFDPEWSMPGDAICAQYYDDYSFISNRNLGEDFAFCSTDFVPTIADDPIAGVSGIQQGSATGKLTGIYTGSGYEVYYYDAQGHEIQRYATGFNQGRRTTFYTYTGKIGDVFYKYNSEQLPGRHIHYSYDNASRPISMTVRESQRPFSWRVDTVPITLSLPSLQTCPYASTRMAYNPIGMVDSLYMGAQIAQKFAYDVHGWSLGSSTLCGTETLFEDIFYNNGDTPRYDGLISAVNRNNGRYDYEYNSRGFLSRANYSSEVSDSIDFSTSYTYNSRGCLTTLYRKGVIDRLPDGTEVFGNLDNIRYTNQGLVPVKMRVRTEAQVFAGRSGIGMDIDADLEYDAAGHLISDPTRGIFLIEYDGRDHPIRTYFDDGHVHYDSYDGLGNHISTTFYEAVGTVVAGHKPSRLRRIARRTYTGDGHILVNDSLQISAFTGGYFDRCGDTHYYINNYRGDIVAIADASGVIEQHNDYYPYGELWRRSGGHPFSFEGKERVDNDGRAELNYGARRYVPATCYFSSPDIAAEDMPFLSSYTFCAANPINIIDPSGNEWQVLQNAEMNFIGFIWIEHEKAYDSSGELLHGVYKQAIFFSKEGINGRFSEDSSYNIGTSTAIVYKYDGSIECFNACTYPSDIHKYVTIPSGLYEAKVGKHKNQYNALRLSDVGTTDFYNSRIYLPNENPNNSNHHYASGINIHKAGVNNKTGLTTSNRPISAGCILIDINEWDSFISNFDNEKESENIIGIIIER